MKTTLSGFGIGIAVLLVIGAASVTKIAYFPSISVSDTNFTSEMVVSNGLKVGSTRLTSLPSGANPTATISGSAVNGSASTYMKSDAAPALANTAVTAGSYGDGTHVMAATVDAQGRLTAASSVSIAGGITGLANPSATIGTTANNGSATTGMRSDATPALPSVLVGTSGFETVWGAWTHAGTVTVDWNGANRSLYGAATGNLTLAWSNLQTNRAMRMLIQNPQASNITLSLPGGTQGYFTTTLSNGWHMLSAECIQSAVNSNVWVSTSSNGTY